LKKVETFPLAVSANYGLGVKLGASFTTPDKTEMVRRQLMSRKLTQQDTMVQCFLCSAHTSMFDNITEVKIRERCVAQVQQVRTH
jgi:hypothetical protein